MQSNPAKSAFGPTRKWSAAEGTSTFESLADVVSKGGRVPHVTLAALRKRERQRKERRKGEGRKAHAELHPDVVAEAKRLRRASPKTGERLSYRQISARLEEAGVSQRAW